MNIKPIATGIALLAMTGLTGCATTSQLDAMKADIANAQA